MDAGWSSRLADVFVTVQWHYKMKLSRQSWSHVIFINSYTILVKLSENIYPRFWFIEIKNNWFETNERVLYLKLSQYHNKD